jgi:hypothetical protein
VYKQEDKSTGKLKRTTTQVIYAYYKHKIDKRDLTHEVLALLYSFFKAFDESADDWLSVGLDFHTKEKKVWRPDRKTEQQKNRQTEGKGGRERERENLN